MVNNNIEEGTLIPVMKSTRERLKQHGKKGDKYDDIINEVLDFFDRLDNPECKICMGKYCSNKCAEKENIKKSM